MPGSIQRIGVKHGRSKPGHDSVSGPRRIYQEEGGILDDARGVIETASGTGDGVSVLVLLIMSVFFAACAVLSLLQTTRASR